MPQLRQAKNRDSSKRSDNFESFACMVLFQADFFFHNALIQPGDLM